MTEPATDIREQLRAAVLEALDASVNRYAAGHGFQERLGAGATDADLPALFRVLDAQFDLAVTRLGVAR